MNRLLSLLTICGLAVLVSCQPEDTIEKDFSFEASATTVNAGETVYIHRPFNKCGIPYLDIPGRDHLRLRPSLWRMSYFPSAGTKEVTLVVTYSDGTEDRGSIDIEVLDPLGAEISVSGSLKRVVRRKAHR